MAGPTYLAAYQAKKLNEIVIPGSHDAGVYTANRANVRTQALNIGEQANAGCRFFDLRIATHKTKSGNRTIYTHKAFHLDESLVGSAKVKNQPGIESHQTLKNIGGWGGTLVDMLNDARAFVRLNPSEFLILKFSKCKNWVDIAETCIGALGAAHYKEAGNLNNKTVQQLAGKVITVFDHGARDVLAPVIRMQAGRPHGVMFIKALYDKETGKSSGYEPHYWGMQYFGKFSSTDKIAKNTAKQTQTLSDGAATHMDVLGMMYWTTTGLFGDISQRNSKMWTKTNITALQKTWESGLEASISHRFGKEKDNALRLAGAGGGALGGRLKSFMPNIVMMDFVDDQKCAIVEQLNTVAGHSLQQLMIPAPRGPQPHPSPVG